MEEFRVNVIIRDETTGEKRKEVVYVMANHWESARVKAYDIVRSKINDYELIMEVYVVEGENPLN